MIPEVFTKVSFKKRFLCLLGKNRNSIDNFIDLLKLDSFHKPKTFESGRDALTFTLKNMKLNNPGKLYVLIQGYGCPSVKNSILSAKLIPIIVDTEINDWKFNRNILDNVIFKYSNKILTIINMNLLGDIRNDLDLKYRNIDVIYDLSQCFPLHNSISKFNNSYAIIYSFGAGKPLPLMNGGMSFISKKEHINPKEDYNKFFFKNILLYLKIILYPIIVTPYIWKYVRKLIYFIQKRISTNLIKDEISQFSQMSSLSASFGLLAYKEVLTEEVKNNKRYQSFCRELEKNKISALKPILSPRYFSGVRAGFIGKDPKWVKKFIANSHKSNIGVTNMYENTIDLKCLNASKLSKLIITIPMHSKVKTKDIKKLIFLSKNT